MAVAQSKRVQFPSLFSEVIAFALTTDVASLIDAAGATQSFTVPGAALGDFVEIAVSLDNQGITVTAYVSAADTVKARFQNESTATVDLASQTIYGVVYKKGPAFDGL